LLVATAILAYAWFLPGAFGLDGSLNGNSYPYPYPYPYPYSNAATVTTVVRDSGGNDVTGGAVSAGTVVHDVASVAKASGVPDSVPDPTGSVNFTLYNNGGCDGSVVGGDANVPLSAGTANSSNFTTSTGSFSYWVHYSGDANYLPGDGTCESFTVVLPKPGLTVRKTCPNGKQSPEDRFGVVLNGTATGDILDCGGQVQLTLEPAAPYTVTEQAAGTTTNLLNYATSYVGCSGTGLARGATATCTITNTRRTPRSKPLTPGYWKTHAPQLASLLPVLLGNFPVASVSSAQGVFAAMNCSASSPADAIGCLAGHLLAARLNVKNGASNCINAVIAQANALLIAVGYQGPNNALTTPPTDAQRQSALQLKSALDKYDNGKGC